MQEGIKQKSQQYYNEVHEAARGYVERGWAVFPVWWVNKDGSCGCGKRDCDRPGKHAIGEAVPNGKNGASTSGLQVDIWWSNFPQANVAIKTGSDSGLVVVDVDSYKGVTFDDPSALRVRTGGGGTHIYYKLNGQKIGTFKGLKGIKDLECIGDGGAVVAPPSRHKSGCKYGWFGKGELSMVPHWIEDEVRERDGIYKKNTETTYQGDGDYEGARRYLATIEGAISGAGGHDATFRAACKLVRAFALSDEDALRLLEQDYNPRCDPPWTLKELKHKVKQARERGLEPIGSKVMDADDFEIPKASPVADMGQDDGPEELEEIEAEEIIEQGLVAATNPKAAAKKNLSEELLEMEDLNQALSDESILQRIKLAQLHDVAEFATCREIFRQKKILALMNKVLKKVVLKQKRAKPDSASGHIVPNGWQLKPLGRGYAISKIVETPDGDLKAIGVSRMPMRVVGITTDIASGKTRHEIEIRSHKRTLTKHVPTLALRSSKAMVEELGALGADCNSNNAKGLVQWFADYEHENRELIEHTRTSSQCGWVDTGFLCGTKPIGCDITYLGSGDGDDNRANRVSSRGDLTSWLKVEKLIGDYPIARSALLASLAAPLIKILRADNFVFDIAYKTSAGKTTTLQLASSVWGNPDNRAHDAYMMSWDLTRVAFERTAAIMCDLPVMLDESKRAAQIRGQSVAPGMAYDYTNGEGRSRGNKTGTEVTKHWRGILLSTGEQSITDMSSHGGVQGRVIPVWGAPFGKPSQEGARTVEAIKDTIADHYGHAGPMFIRYLLDNKGQWGSWRERFRAMAKQAAEDMQQHEPAIASRLARYVAVIEMAGQLWADCTGNGPDYQSLLPFLCSIGEDGESTTNITVSALRHLASWCAQNQDYFDGRCQDGMNIRLLGKWEKTEAWNHIAILPGAFNDAMTQAGFEPAAIRKQMKEDGYLLTGNGTGTTKNTRVGGVQTKCICILRTALEL